MSRDLCECGDDRALVLACTLKRDHLLCAKCEGEVPSARLELPKKLAHQLQRWMDQRYALELLWISSAEYEEFALKELDDPKSPINQLGRSLVPQLQKSGETWFWHTPRMRGPEVVSTRLERCFFCDKETSSTAYDSRFGLACTECRVIGPAE